MNEQGLGLPEKKGCPRKKKNLEGMNMQGMKKAFVPCLLLILVGLALFPGGAAAGNVEVKSVTRDAPAEFSAGETVEVTLNIEGELPLAVGIVEEIPEGCHFSENDEEISDAEYFQADRENGKISFSSINTTEIKYRVIASSDSGKDNFEGQWVDLLVQTQELNEGKERWKTVVDPNTLTPAMESRTAKAPGEDDAEEAESSLSTPGFETGISVLALLSCLFAFLAPNSKRKKGGKKE